MLRKKISMKNKIWLVLLFGFAIGCGSGQKAGREQPAESLTQTEVQKQEERVTETDVLKDSGTDELVYSSEFLGNIVDIAVTEDGRLYAIEFQELSQSYMESNGKELLIITQPKLWLYEFDSNGACVCFGGSLYSSGDAMTVEWAEDSLYVVVPGVNGVPALYQVGHLSEVSSDVVETYKKIRETIQETDENISNYTQEFQAFRDLDIWTLQELYCFDIFSEITRLVFLGDRLYVYGILETLDENSLVQNIEFSEMHPNTDIRQAVGYLDMKNLEAGVTLLSMNGIPQDMIKFDENTLGIYLAGEDAASFWKYIPANEIWEQTDIAEVKYSETTEDTASYSELAAYEDGCFYVKDDNVVCYKTVTGTECELFESDGSVQCLKTDGTYLYYYSDEWAAREVRRIGISGVLEGRTE